MSTLDEENEEYNGDETFAEINVRSKTSQAIQKHNGAFKTFDTTPEQFSQGNKSSNGYLDLSEHSYN